MKVNMINNGISEDSYVRDLPNVFVYYMEDKPFSVWKSFAIDMSFTARSLYDVRSFVSFYLDGRDTFEVKVVDNAALVGEVFNFDHDGVKIVPVNDVEIAELNVKF